MYGASNPIENTYLCQGNEKYFSPRELSQFVCTNIDVKPAEKSETKHKKKHPNARDPEEKHKKRMHKEKNKKKGDDRRMYNRPYYIMTNLEDEKKKERKLRKERTKEFPLLHCCDLDYLKNDCSGDFNMQSNIKTDRNNELKKHQRSQSIDRIPTKDISSDQKLIRRLGRPKSVERKENIHSENKRDHFMKYYSQNLQNDLISSFDQQYLLTNEQYPLQHITKKHREKSKHKKKKNRDDDFSEFITCNQLNEEKVNINTEKVDYRKNNHCDIENNVHHHHQRDLYREYLLPECEHNTELPNNIPNFNELAINEEEFNTAIHNYYRNSVNDEIILNRTKKKDRKRERNKEQKKKEIKDYKAVKKYLKRLSREKPKEAFFFTTNDLVLPVLNRKQRKKRNNIDRNENFGSEFDQNIIPENTATVNEYKLSKKEFIPIDLGLDELEIPQKPRKSHDHKKHKSKKEAAKKESVQRMRSVSVNSKEKYRNINAKFKSDTSFDSLKNEKHIVCIYQTKESQDEATVELTKKQECVKLDTGTKTHRKASEIFGKEKIRSPHSRYQMILPSEQKKQITEMLNNQERSLLFQKAIKRDFPPRPRPRSSRSRQRSSKHLKDDEEPTKEVQCYDVGTSTILDNNFGEVLELLKGEQCIFPPCPNKRRSVFHTRKQVSSEDLIETSRKACGNDEKTLGIVVKGVEPPRKIETPKVRSRFKISGEKSKTKKLECKILSVIAIAPNKLENNHSNLEQYSQSATQMQHNICIEKRNIPTDKRLQRLLRYYKVDSQTKLSAHSHRKPMKELIAEKLNDYLKKLQDDEDDGLLQIQTDDARVIKLILPIDFLNSECSKCPLISDQDEKLKESFSDLYINYSAENNTEHEVYPHSYELSKNTADNVAEFGQKTITASSEIQSEQIENSQLNLFDISNSASIPKRINENPSTCLEFAKDYQFSETQINRKSSTKLSIQTTQIRNDNISFQKLQNKQFHNFPHTLYPISPQCSENMVEIEENNCSLIERNKNSVIDRNESSKNLNNIENLTEQRVFFDKMSFSPPEGLNTSIHSNQKIRGEYVSTAISEGKNIEIKKHIQVDEERNSYLRNIDEGQIEKNEPDIVLAKRSLYNREPRAQSNSDPAFNRNYGSLDGVDTSTQYFPNEIELLENFNQQQDEKYIPSNSDVRDTVDKDNFVSDNIESLPTSYKESNEDFPVQHQQIDQNFIREDSEEVFFDVTFRRNSRRYNGESSRPISFKNTSLNTAAISCEVKRTDKMNNPQSDHKIPENSPPTKGFEYFEIPLNPKSVNKVTEFDEKYGHRKFKDNSSSAATKIERLSQIPKRIMSSSKGKYLEQTNCEAEKQPFKNSVTKSSEYQERRNELDNSVQKCLNWNIRNSDTVVISDDLQNVTSETEKSTVIPKKSNIPISKRSQSQSKANVKKSSSAQKDKTPTMLLTKTFKPDGPSSYEKRKMYDTRLRKNVKKRSLSECSGQPKISPLVYEVMYCNVFNHCNPLDSGLGGSRSDQNLSAFSVDFDSNNIKKTLDTLTTIPSCFLKTNEFRHNDVDPCFVENLDDIKTSKEFMNPSCFIDEKDQKNRNENYSTQSSSTFLENEVLNLTSFSTEPSCLLKDSKYNVPMEEYHQPRKTNISIEDHEDDEETCSIHSSKSERIKNLIKNNLLYVNSPPKIKKFKTRNNGRKRRNKEDIQKNLETIDNRTLKSKSKTSLKCSEKPSKESSKRLKIIAMLNDYRNDEVMWKNSSNKNHYAPGRQNLTKLSIDKVNENELRVSFEEEKFGSVENEVSFVGKSSDRSIVEKDSINNSESSKSTLVNSKTCSSITSEESEETIKQSEAIDSSAGDSGYLTKSVKLNNSEINLDNTNIVKSSNFVLELSTESSPTNISNWNEKDLLKLKIQLLFPHVYDYFEPLESAQNTDLIKFYVESESDKLKKAIDSISHGTGMSARSRSVISLPSVKVMSEESTEILLNGVVNSDFPTIGQNGGFCNYQKFVLQNNKCCFEDMISEFNDFKDSAKTSNPTVKVNVDVDETESINSCNISSPKSRISLRNSVVELFKLKPSSVQKFSSSISSDNVTYRASSEGDRPSISRSMSDEEFYENLPQIMKRECQKYAKKVRNQNKFVEVEEAQEYEEISLDRLLKNKKFIAESRENVSDQPFQMTLRGNHVDLSSHNGSSDSFNMYDLFSKKDVNLRKSNTQLKKLSKKRSPYELQSKIHLDFYTEEKMPITGMLQNIQVRNIEDDSRFSSPKKIKSDSSGEVSNKQSEKQFFDSLLAFYDKKSELIKKIIRDDQFFSTLIETIRSTEDDSTYKDCQEKSYAFQKKEKKRSILSRFFRRKQRRSADTIREPSSIERSLELAESMTTDNAVTVTESFYSFSRDLDNLVKDSNEVKRAEPEYLQQLAYKAKCHLAPMVKATISNSYISDKLKLAGFLKMLDMVAKGEFTFLINGDDKSLEEKLKEHVSQMFEKVYRIANHEVVQKHITLDDTKIQLLRVLVTKYHIGMETHLNILSIYIGRNLIKTEEQLEDAIIFLMGQDSQDVVLEQLERTCGISSE